MPVFAGGLVAFADPSIVFSETGLEHMAPGFESLLRYLAGLLFAIGLGFWSCVPRIETKAGRMLLLTCLVFIGGVARLLFEIRNEFDGSLFSLVMELFVTPVLCLWQRRVAIKLKTL